MTELFTGCRVTRKLRSDATTDLYEALQEPLGRPVLIKALSPSILPSSPFAAALEREARVMASLDHPGIVRLVDFVRRDDRMWLVLETTDGWSLGQVMERLGETGSSPVEPEAVAAIAWRVAQALVHAHGRGVVHRGLEPSRILLTRHGEVKLTGFAVTGDDGPESVIETIDPAVGAGFEYASPEQILGEPPDPRSDFFSLGIVLYELASGRHPFRRATHGETAQAIRHDSPELLARLVPTVPGPLERLISRCLEKLPADRFQSALELARASEVLLTDGTAREPSRVLVELLGRAQLVERDSSAPSTPRGREKRAPHGLPLGGFIAALLGFIVAGGVIQSTTSKTSSADDGHVEKLPLVPESAAELRVVATPWAHVFIDGQQVETTPFARAIPLAPGVHHLRLDHPQAPSEHRTLRLAAGEHVLVDVAMKLDVPAPPLEPVLPPPPEDESP